MLTMDGTCAGTKVEYTPLSKGTHTVECQQQALGNESCSGLVCCEDHQTNSTTMEKADTNAAKRHIHPSRPMLTMDGTCAGTKVEYTPLSKGTHTVECQQQALENESRSGLVCCEDHQTNSTTTEKADTNAAKRSHTSTKTNANDGWHMCRHQG